MRMMWLWMETTSTFMSCWPKSMLVMHASRSFKPPASSPSTLFPAQCRWEAYAFPKRCLLLFGAEGPGLSEKALALADDVVYISQFGSVRSINAGAAAAVAMHAWIAQHAVSGV